MGRQTEFDGLVYCDWRINVRNCVDEEFFFGVQAFGGVTFFLTVVILGFLIFFRAVILKQSFHHGANLGLIGIFLSSICFTMNNILLFFGNSPVAAGIFWGLALSIGLLPHIVIAYSLTMVLPGYINPGDQAYIRYIPTPKIFGKIMIFFGVQLNIIYIVLLGLSEHWNSIGDFERSNRLFIGALVYISICLIIFLPYHLYCSLLFLKIGTEKLEMIGKNFEESEAVRIALFKAKQNIRAIFMTDVLFLFPLLSLAIDDHIFKNLPLSKACCFVISILSVLLLMLNLMYLATDIKKKLLNNKKKKSSQDRSTSSLKARSHSKPNLMEPQIESLETINHDNV